MTPRFRPLALALSLFGLVLVAGCGGPQVHPLRDLHPKPAPFSLVATTNVLMNYGGELEEQAVDRNVLPAQEAIELMTGKGYVYAPNGPVQYAIKADMLCYDPQLVSTVHAQDDALDIMEPVAPDTFAEAMDRAVMQETWYQYPKQPGPDMCVGKIFLTVTSTTGEEEKEIFKGGVYAPGCPYENDCAYSACSNALSAKLEQMLQKLF
jgi:hypothetical protein